MGVLGYSQGSQGYLGIKIMWRPGDATNKYAWAAPDQWLLAETKKLNQAYTHIEHDAFVGSRDTDTGHRHGKGGTGGPVELALYPSNGEEFWEAALGFKGNVDAIAADTTTGIQNGPMDAPGVVTTAPSGTGGTLAAGTYKYRVAFGTQFGQTLGGAETAGDVLSGSTSSEVLSAIPTGPVGTTYRAIFRKKDAGTYALVHTLADNTTATWTDTGAATPGAAPVTFNTSVPANLSILGLTLGDAAYTVPSKGRFVLVDDGFKQEIRPVIDYDTTGKLLFVGLLGERDGREISHTSVGCSVVAPAVALERTLTKTDYGRNYTNMLPYFAAEDNNSGSYSYRYRGGLVGKLNLKAAAAKVTLTADLQFNKPRQLANGVDDNPDPTEFDESDTSLEDLSYEYQDGFLAFESDPDATGTPVIQRVDDGVTWEIDIDNALKEEATMDGTDSKRYFPGGKRKISMKLSALHQADYPVFFEKFVKKDTDTQFFGHFALNDGPDHAPSWRARSFYEPHVRWFKSEEASGLTDTKGEMVEGVARRSGGMEKIYVYSMT